MFLSNFVNVFRGKIEENAPVWETNVTSQEVNDTAPSQVQEVVKDIAACGSPCGPQREPEQILARVVLPSDVPREIWPSLEEALASIQRWAQDCSVCGGGFNCSGNGFRKNAKYRGRQYDMKCFKKHLKCPWRCTLEESTKGWLICQIRNLHTHEQVLPLSFV